MSYQDIETGTSTIQQPQASSSLVITHNVSLADKNWFRTGGPARFFCEPTTAAEFQHALAYAHEHNLALFVLGEGANVLISDAGFNGLVIHPKLTTITHTPIDALHAHVTAGAGTSIHDLIVYCLDHNLVGLEEFSGIPGTLGGSIYINLHYFEFLLSHFLINATIINRETGQVQMVAPEWFGFGYNTSKLQEHTWYVVDATLKVRSVDAIETAYAKGRRTEIIRHRKSRYPAQNTCGSFFRNFHADEVTLESNGKKMIYVAYYLDKIGVKGALTSGDAIVSYQHANMLVNRGNATSSDLINLARTMQELVLKEFGIIPRPECLLIGFDEYPLLK